MNEILLQLREDLRELDRCRIREDIKECLSMNENEILKVEARESFEIDFYGEILLCESV